MTIASDYSVLFLTGAWGVFAAMAPYLLFGFLIAGILSIFISPEWVERHLGGRGFIPVLKSVLFGIPLPLCSCGVIPVTASIRRHGASRGATTGFLLATPQTGVDSILATWGLLGPVIGVFRPLAALVTGVLGGTLVSLTEGETQREGAEDEPTPDTCTDACCAPDDGQSKALRALRYGFVTLPADIGRALILGILVAALIATFVPKGFLVQYLGGGVGAMVAMVLVGIPIYVCSTASIPVAIGFIHLGASPGAALAFLIAGPATNAATVAMTWRVLGRRTAIIYLLTVAVTAMAAGLGFDALVPHFGDMGLAAEVRTHEMATGWFGHASGVAFLLVLVYSLAGRRLVERKPALGDPSGDDDLATTVTLAVTGMTCSHCSGTVRRGLQEVAGVRSADVDLEAGRAVVTGDALDAGLLMRTVEGLGYGAEVAV
ncbi:MAG: SO_0444 family Cu/Zn efflux transporter [bacterium]|nr:SO_0444 family Cu/Zn efflux transporter [bacterium]